MPYFQKEECQIYYETFGDSSKEALLMLHGNGENGAIFEKQIAYFSKNYYVITMDMRGHGKSMLGSIPLNFDVFSQDVLAMLDLLHIEQVHILGFSDGGNTAIQFALSHENRVKSIIANGADLNTKGIKGHIQFFIVLAYWMIFVCSRCFHSLKKREQVMGLMVHYPHITYEQLETIELPVLVLVGHKDMVKEEHSRSIAAHVKHGELVILQGSHFIYKDCPQEYNQAIEKFLISQGQ